jgi:hypothetical protein
MKLQLILQETTNGLTTQFISEGININNYSIKTTLKDERMLTTQLVNQSIVYSIQIIDNLKVISYIDTTITDFTGRAGYLAIKLYLPINLGINNCTSLLDKIKLKYYSLKAANQLSTQNYNDILNEAEITENTDVFCKKSEKTAFKFYDSSFDVENVLQSEKILVFGKLYLFEKEKAIDSQLIVNNGFSTFESVTAGLIKVKVFNKNNILTSLLIGNYKLAEASFPESFFILTNINEKIYYQTRNNFNQQIGEIKNSELFIEENVINSNTFIYQDYKNGDYTGNQTMQKSFFSKFQIPIISAVILFFTSVCFFVIKFYFDQKQVVKNTQTKEIPIQQKIEDSTFFHFKNLGDTNELKHFYITEFNDSIKNRSFGVLNDGLGTVSCFIINLKKQKPVAPKILDSGDLKYLQIPDSLYTNFAKELEKACGCIFILQTEKLPKDINKDTLTAKQKAVNK